MTAVSDGATPSTDDYMIALRPDKKRLRELSLHESENSCFLDTIGESLVSFIMVFIFCIRPDDFQGFPFRSQCI